MNPKDYKEISGVEEDKRRIYENSWSFVIICVKEEK